MAADNHREPQTTDLVNARLQRAAKRLQDRDHVGALDDLRAVLQHLRRVGADPHLLQCLADIIEREEQEAEEASSN